MECYKCIISGRVQHVYYRKFTAQALMKKQFKGYIQNLPDGTVEVVAEVFDYRINPKTKKKDSEKSWIKIKQRNDAIDTSTMALTLADMDKVILIKRPAEEDIGQALAGLNFG